MRAGGQHRHAPTAHVGREVALVEDEGVGATWSPRKCDGRQPGLEAVTRDVAAGEEEPADDVGVGVDHDVTACCLDRSSVGSGGSMTTVERREDPTLVRPVGVEVDDDRPVARPAAGLGDGGDGDRQAPAVVPVPVGQEHRLDGGQVDAEAGCVVHPHVPVRADVEQHRCRASPRLRGEDGQPVARDAQLVERDDAS